MIRVIKIDAGGNRVWDMTRGMIFGLRPEDSAKSYGVDPSGLGATVSLANVIRLRVDGDGA